MATTPSSAQLATLREKALAARTSSYSPYSRFRVGACILAADGAYIPGTNVENASYGASICAERSAIVAAVVLNPGLPLKLTNFRAKESPPLSLWQSPPPQRHLPSGLPLRYMQAVVFLASFFMMTSSIREFFSQDAPVYLLTPDGEYETMTVAQLLPNSFGPEDLQLKRDSRSEGSIERI
ncbi:Cytidine deaminase [Neolecta irregularis DAH-3]|uniref:Cytidine deaminase n=1 Tax=Neolecta irregularis (strain DAH-3) TaxID=1198029 RepID=A0A1U7LLM0_NEOID|nr:Cytidine deaminase [Neolecta irregularis DAH-3]|eukprot:OLL23483.1 Cytidine deaminase [Neolecta irregularis DAH-3]